MNAPSELSAPVRLPIWLLGSGLYAAMLLLCFAAQGAVLPEALDRHVADDTYYFLQIAQHMAAGQGSCFSPGEPTNGYHPLWQWILSALIWLLPLSRSAMAILCVSLSAVLMAWSAVAFARFLRALGVDGGRARFCALVYLANPWVACLAINGMETALFLLLLFTLLAWVPGRAAAAIPGPTFGAFAGLLMLARTDSIFFTSAVFLYFALTRSRSWKWILVAGGVSVAVVSPWLLWSYVTFGSIQQSSSDAIALIANAQMPPGIHAFVQAGIDCFTRVMYIALVYPLVRHSSYIAPYQYHWGVVCLALGLVYLVHRRLRPAAHLPLPPWFWVPVAALVVYFTCFRHFLQVWHLSTLIVLCVAIAGHGLSGLGRRGRGAALASLALASLWATRNGFFAPQEGEIAFARRFASEPRPALLIGHTDGGRFAYFGRDEVVNLDGVVNNTVLKYIRAGRICDYLFARRFDRVMMTPSRFGFYNRNAATRPVAELPPAAPGGATVRGFVDRVFAEGDRITIEGWVDGGPWDAAASFPMLAFLDAAQAPLATFEGTRRDRDDVATAFGDRRLRFAGCRFELDRGEIPAQTRFVRLGARARDASGWCANVKGFTLP